MPAPTEHHYRKEEKDSLLLRYWWVGLIVAAFLVGGAAFLLRPNRGKARQVVGYIPATGTLEQEYAKYYGKKLNQPEVVQEWDQVNTMIAKRDYAGAASLLETVSKAAAVPAVFNNLGVLYAELNDRARCINAFREALARDTAYRPVRENLNRLKGFVADSADPVTHEIEPNGTTTMANIMANDIPVDGAIAEQLDDADCYRITTLPPPRDIVDIEIVNRSKTLIPGLRIYDANSRLTDLGQSAAGPGQALNLTLVPEPNTTFYLQVIGMYQTGGEYTLRVKQRHAADVFEPNDDIFNSHPITPEQTIEANIMDTVDTDFFSFRAARTGTVNIDVQNRSDTLIPALTTFTEERRNNGFGPDLNTPGANLHYTMQVQENRTYYLQIWSQGNSAGAYALTVK